jgi:hypothetical protein
MVTGAWATVARNYLKKWFTVYDYENNSIVAGNLVSSA